MGITVNNDMYCSIKDVWTHLTCFPGVRGDGAQAKHKTKKGKGAAQNEEGECDNVESPPRQSARRPSRRRSWVRENFGYIRENSGRRLKIRNFENRKEKLKIWRKFLPTPDFRESA